MAEVTGGSRGEPEGYVVRWVTVCHAAPPALRPGTPGGRVGQRVAGATGLCAGTGASPPTRSDGARALSQEALAAELLSQTAAGRGREAVQRPVLTAPFPARLPGLLPLTRGHCRPPCSREPPGLTADSL